MLFNLCIHLKSVLNRTPPPVLTYVCHVQAVLLGSVVPVGGDGGHVHTVDLPYGRVAAVEMAAVGAGSHVVWTFMFGPLTVNMREKVLVSKLIHALGHEDVSCLEICLTLSSFTSFAWFTESFKTVFLLIFFYKCDIFVSFHRCSCPLLVVQVFLVLI